MSNDFLRECCDLGLTDAKIGLFLGLTGEGVAYRRKKLGISVLDKYNDRRESICVLNATSTEELQATYYNLTQEDFSKKYGVSKTVWRPILKERGIISKKVHRIESYPAFNKEQRSLIIGSLLGDGSVSQGNFFYESHSLKQKNYIKKKFDILKPYSKKLYSCDDGGGLRFKTAQHPNFLEFHDQFYAKGVKGKLVPTDFIAANWQDIILSYWFFDDGYYDRKRNELTIANKCPDLSMLREFVQFLENRFKWRFTIWYKAGIHHVTFSKKYYLDFSTLLLDSATPDLFYKIPTQDITDA